MNQQRQKEKKLSQAEEKISCKEWEVFIFLNTFDL